MTCAEVRSRSRDIVRQTWLSESENAAAAAHLRHCPQCAAWLEAQRALDARLREIGGECADGSPSQAVESAVMEAFVSRSPTPGRRRRLAWIVPAAAAAMVLIGLLWHRMPRAEPAAATRQESVSGFIPVRYGAPIRPLETLQVMRVELPRAELLRLGLPVGPDNARGMVRADVLLGEDGLVKGIRFVYGSQELQSRGVTQ